MNPTVRKKPTVAKLELPKNDVKKSDDAKIETEGDCIKLRCVCTVDKIFETKVTRSFQRLIVAFLAINTSNNSSLKEITTRCRILRILKF